MLPTYRLSCFLLAAFLASAGCEKFKVIREWNYLNFTWPDEESYRTSVSAGLYVPQNALVSGVKEFEGYFYLTLPRMRSGVPATLARVASGPTPDPRPALEPFPSWEMNREGGDCGSLQNVQNVEIDSSGKLWIVDSGRTETLDQAPAARCPPKLVVFDIEKNVTTTAYTFPEGVADPKENFLYDLVVDDTDGGYAYITDNSATDPGIIVFSAKDHRSWKIRHSQSMRADPAASTFRVNGILVRAPINVAGIALGPKVRNFTDRLVISEDRDVYYSPLSSLHLYSVNTSVLRDETNAKGEYQGEVVDHGMKGSQSVGMIMDDAGVLYYSLLSTNSIARWDSHVPFEKNQRIIARDQRYLEWPNSFSFDRNGNITVLVNRLEKFIYDSLDLNEANFRLITSHVGGRSYVYDRDYEYGSEGTTADSVMEPAKMPLPDVLTHSDQDPYMMPHGVYQTPQPGPSGDLDHRHDNSTDSKESTQSSAAAVGAFMVGAAIVVSLNFLV